MNIRVAIPPAKPVLETEAAVISALATLALATLLTACGPAPPTSSEPTENRETPPERARFEPPDGTVLVFAGQSNDAVGGHDPYQDGYVDHFGVPAGITHYGGFLEAVTTDLGFEFDEGRIEGLNTWDNWGAGPMCLKCYLDDPDFEGAIVHLGLSLEHGSAERLARGEDDANLEELAAFLTTYADHPFFLRIGYEFDGPWNGYEPGTYKAAFTRIVDHLRQAGVTNFATVFAASHLYLSREKWEAYYPGDGYVDWLGYSWWSEDTGRSEEEPVPVAAILAREWRKPILMAEVGPRHHRIGQDDTEKVWAWYASLFEHLEKNADVVKGLAIINNHWDPEPMWKDGDWGDFRISNDTTVQARWREAMAEPRFLHEPATVYDLIGFQAP